MEKKVIYYEDKKGRKPVKEFINKFDDKTKAKILARIEFLGEHWNEIRRPFVDSIGNKLYELRIQFSQNKIRIIYAFMLKNYIVLLHSIVKRIAKIPENDKLKAKKRMIDFEIQYNERSIKL